MVAPFGKPTAAMSPKDEPSPPPQEAPQHVPQAQQAPQAQQQSTHDRRDNLAAYCERRGLTVGAALRAFLRDRLSSEP
jgi:hypothetical protein